jgi:hypothetical protein
VQQRFTLDRMVAAHLALYAAVLEQASAVPRGAEKPDSAAGRAREAARGPARDRRRFGRSPHE